jgi:outer membrane protein TolC
VSKKFFCRSLALSILFASSTIWSNSFAQTTDDNATEAAAQIEYVNFLDILPNALELDEGIKLAEFGKLAANESAKAAWSVWYPKADVTLSTGEQYDVKPGGSNNGVTSPGLSGDGGTGSSNQRYNPTEAKLKISQKLWDFGEAKAGIENSKLGVAQADLGITAAKNNAIKAAAQVYIGLKRAHSQYKLALEAEAQLKRQTGQQDFRVSRGAAVGTDVLQAKNALAGAVTARVAAQGSFQRALTDFENRFGFAPINVDLLLPIRVPNSLIPQTKDDFRDAVMLNGEQLKRARLAFDRAKINADKAFASAFLPELKATAEMNYKGDAGGSLGGKTEYIGKVELSWPIELFGTQMNTYRASGHNFESANLTYAKSQRDVENSISNAWIGFQTSSASRANIQNQVEIARQFLRLAQMEVQQGRGQMILVVNAQNALVNAQKALENNSSDYAVQVYNLLSQMGALSVEQLQNAAMLEDEARAKAIEDYKKRVEEMGQQQDTQNQENNG